ncbi:MAG: hypothetical protein AB7S75_19250 [Desulfococcaceae bacterium]
MQTVLITLAEPLIQGMAVHELQHMITESLAVRKYLKQELSMGEVAEILGMGYAQTHEWMNAQGIATTRKLPPDLKAKTDRNRENLEKRLGIY